MNRRVDRLLRTAFEQYGERIYRSASVLLGNAHEAEDLCQNAFVELAKSLDRFEGRSSLYTWLYRIMLHLYYKEMRDRGKADRMRERAAEMEPDAPEAGLSCPDNGGNKDYTAVLRQRIQELPKIHQSVLVLKYFQGLSYEEISEVLDCPVGTVRSRLHIAKKELRERMEEDLHHEL